MDRTGSPPSRTSGVLLHPTALPNSPVCGSFGSPSRKWLQLLACNGIGVWQFLPLCPPDTTGSPYSSPSCFALNPWFVDAQDLVEEGFLSKNDLEILPGAKELKSARLDLALANERSDHLGLALRNSWHYQSLERHLEFEEWRKRQEWLEDYVAFVVLRKKFENLPWWKWPEPYSKHDDNFLSELKISHENDFLEHCLLQWHLDRQWQLIRSLAKDLGILLFGDMPFYVSRDSSDVWGNRKLFSIDSHGDLDFQSGVPPDYFSSTGQLWGTPVYFWENHFSDNFSWWRSRFGQQWNQVDLLRLDHFRALVAYWAVPGDNITAQEGEWIESPGEELLKLIQKDYEGHLPLIAEDLGLITDEVERLRDQFNLSGMKVLQFAFDGDPDNTHLPKNIIGDSWVVYTGTHDNPTTLSWWNDLKKESKEDINDNYHHQYDSPSWRFIDIGMSTSARLFIAPIQDILKLDDASRFNQPGTVGNNWIWRVNDFDSFLISSLKKFGQRSLHWNR